MNEKAPRRSTIERLRARKRRHAERSRTYRISFAALGFLSIALGVLLSLPLVPGPGLPLIVVGLAMLSLEFDWAERLLERVLVRVERAKERTMTGSPVRRALASIAVLVIAACLVAAAAVVWDVPLWPL